MIILRKVLQPFLRVHLIIIIELLTFVCLFIYFIFIFLQLIINFLLILDKKQNTLI